MQRVGPWQEELKAGEAVGPAGLRAILNGNGNLAGSGRQGIDPFKYLTYRNQVFIDLSNLGSFTTPNS